jgi:hypothetical protein
MYISYYNLKIAMLNAISQLVMFTALIGRFSVMQIAATSLFYNFSWNLCHMLCVSIQRGSPDARIFDDFAISNVYLFAACFGLVVTWLIKAPPSTDR